MLVMLLISLGFGGGCRKEMEIDHSHQVRRGQFHVIHEPFVDLRRFIRAPELDQLCQLCWTSHKIFGLTEEGRWEAKFLKVLCPQIQDEQRRLILYHSSFHRGIHISLYPPTNGKPIKVYFGGIVACNNVFFLAR